MLYLGDVYYGPNLCVEPKKVIGTEPSPMPADGGAEEGSTP